MPDCASAPSPARGRRRGMRVLDGPPLALALALALALTPTLSRKRERESFPL